MGYSGVRLSRKSMEKYALPGLCSYCCKWVVYKVLILFLFFSSHVRVPLPVFNIFTNYCILSIYGWGWGGGNIVVPGGYMCRFLTIQKYFCHPTVIIRI